MISLIVPYYKNIESIDNTLKSLNFALQQCHSLYVEVVFINNNSFDGTQKKVRSFQPAKGHVVHVSEKNQGVSNARNTGISASSGKYIAFLDADDALNKDYFSDITYAIKFNPDIVFIKHGASAEIQTYKTLSASEMVENHLKGWWNCQFVFKKSLTTGLKFQGACFEDFGFFPHIVARAQNCILLESGLYQYNDNPASVTKRAIDWRISELQGQINSLRLSSNELGIDIFKRVQRDFYEHISLLRAIAGYFPVLGVIESLTLLRLSNSWRVRLKCAQRLLRLNGSILYRAVKSLILGLPK